MYKRTREEVDRDVQKFVKWVFDNFNNPGKLPKVLQHYFHELEKVTCGFTYGFGEEYWGHIDCFFIIDGEARGYLKKGTYSHDDKVSLTDFIHEHFNPSGLYVLEKLMFDYA